MNQNDLRKKLSGVIADGLVAKAIAVKTGIAVDILSRFKNGHVCLNQSDAIRLEKYLDRVIIP